MLNLSEEELKLLIIFLNIGHEYSSMRFSDTWDALESKDYSHETLSSYRSRVGLLLEKLENSLKEK